MPPSYSIHNGADTPKVGPNRNLGQAPNPFDLDLATSPSSAASGRTFSTAHMRMRRNESSLSHGWAQSYLQKNNQSFLNSWSTQYLHTKTVPAINTMTLSKEDTNETYPSNIWSEKYMFFWYVAAGAVLLFAVFPLTQNNLITVHGGDGALAMSLISFFYTLSAMFAPFVLQRFAGGHASFLLFLSSCMYALFIFASAIGNIWFVYLAACTLGSMSGTFWVSWSAHLTACSRNIAEHDFLNNVRTRMRARLEKAQQSDLDELSADYKELQQKKRLRNEQKIEALLQQLLLPNGRINLTKLTDEQMKRLINSSNKTVGFLTSIGHCILNFNQAFGGLLGYTVLASVTTGNDSAAAAKSLLTLFWFFFAVAVVASLVLFFAYKATPVAIYAPNDQPMQRNEGATDPETGEVPSDIVEKLAVNSPPVSPDVQIHGDDLNANNNDNNLIAPPEPTPYSTSSVQYMVVMSEEEYVVNNLDKIELNLFYQIRDTLYLQYLLVKQRVIAISLLSYFAVTMPTHFFVAIFCSHVVRPEIGVEYIPIFSMMFSLCNGSAALVLTKLLRNYHHAKLCGIAGTTLQFLAAAICLVYSPSHWDTTTMRWVMTSLLFGMAGVGDALNVSGQMGGLGMLLEGSPQVRGAGFGVYQTVRSAGSMSLFICAKFLGFFALNLIACVVLFCSFAGQWLTYINHVPVDHEYLLDKQKLKSVETKKEILVQKYYNEYLTGAGGDVTGGSDPQSPDQRDYFEQVDEEN